MKTFLTGAIVALGVSAAAHAGAGFEYLARVNDYKLDFSNDRFEDSQFFGSIRNTVKSDSGDRIDWTFFTPATSFGHTITNFGNLRANNIQTVSVGNANRTTWESKFDETGIARVDLDWRDVSGGQHTVSVEDDLYTLRLTSSASSFINPIGLHEWILVIPGDWSNEGTGSGMSELVAMSNLWSVEERFVFDGENTTFKASRASSSSGDVPINIEIVLRGAAIPAPGAFALLPLLGTGAFRRRRRARR
ncbi:MAG: hypothetical protein AAGD00_00930 [Planctomycetota bacterium]